MSGQDNSGSGFTHSGIMKHSAEEGGRGFGLFRDQGRIFIGYAENIQSSRLALLARPEFQQERPDGFVFEPWPEDRRVQRRDELVMEYYPSLNLKISGLP